MDYKAKLDLIRKFVFGEQPPAPPAPPAVPAKLETQELKTTDGKVLTVDKLEVGGNVLLEGAAAPDGEYMLDNGGKLSVVGGLISELELEPKPAEQPATPEEMKTPEQFKTALEKFADPATPPDLQKLATIVKALFERQFGWELREAEERATRDAAIATYKTGFEAQNSAFKEMFAVVEALAQAPVASPAQAPKKQWHEMSALEKFRASKQN